MKQRYGSGESVSKAERARSWSASLMNASRQIGHGNATVLSPDALARLSNSS